MSGPISAIRRLLLWLVVLFLVTIVLTFAATAGFIETDKHDHDNPLPRTSETHRYQHR